MNSDDEETCEKEFVTSFDPSSITIDDLAIWLEEVLSKHDSDTDQSVVAKFKAERIDGHVFNDMLEDELKEFLPLFGERKKVLSEWQKIKEGYSSEGSVNTFRNTSLISKEIIKFGCACLNERMNGTIHIGVSSNEKKRIEMERQVAEDYYRGGMVSWPNFHFSKQVLERDIHPDLNATVVAALEGLTDDNDDSIKRVTIYHQPGSGGSTTARQMLWNSRMMYRCCVVKNITKQTSEQICRLHNYEENHEEANPVLLLIDTFDEKLVKQLYDDLGSESRKYNCDVFCVLLICMRVSELPLEKPKNYAMLQQYLSNKEHDWFKKKYKNLLDKHKKKSGCDPKTLLAFNIMKVNFDKRAIENSVLEFVRDESTNVDQRTMLKYLAFINAYDLSFELVPVVCFDPIMETKGQWEIL
ncbi:sterile alpha motif domain-containing protein 9-like [Mytilus galloprovincialis]|uniref:sterile alpha motif domain-containing protein 9-like n=1 Tax=Mytilus galloprovincialis TaxID=29158 RepID=UPI003F7CD121